MDDSSEVRVFIHLLEEEVLDFFFLNTTATGHMAELLVVLHDLVHLVLLLLHLLTHHCSARLRCTSLFHAHQVLQVYLEGFFTLD